MISEKLVLAFVLATFAYLLKIVLTGQKSPISKLPGPWYSKYTNAVLRFQILSGRRIFYVDNLHRQYGSVVRISPNEVAVSDLAGVTQIHKNGSGFLKGAFYSDIARDGKDLGIFFMRDPHAHAARRKLFSRAFSNSSIRSNWEAVVQQKTKLAVESIKKDALHAQKGGDVLKWWTLLATDVIAHLSFGESFNMLELGKQTPYIDALQDTMLGGIIRSEMPLVYAALRHVPSKRIHQITTADDTVYAYGGQAIKNMQKSNGNAMNLFGLMVAAYDGTEKASLTEKQIREEAGNLIVAGSDTTAITLTYLVWAVLKDPSLQNILEDEVAHIGDDLNMTELEAAPILNSVIEESLRLYGAAPGALPRIVPSQGMIAAGHHIPAGVEVSTQAYTNHRDPSVFPDPLRFDGLRFVDKAAISIEQKAALMPFGAGPRVCIGLHLARMELRIGAALFFRECRGAKLSDEMRDDMMEMDNRFLIAPKGHCCYVKLK